MAKTTTMRLVELMVLKEDIHSVLHYLGQLGQFQFQQNFEDSISSDKAANPDKVIFDRLEQARASLDIPDLEKYNCKLVIPSEDDAEKAVKICETAELLHKKELDINDEEQKASSSYKEALAFSNLKVSYNELENLSFLTLRIGKIDPEKLEILKMRSGSRAVIVPLGEDKTRILAACSKKARFGLDADLKECGFVELEIPKDFAGIPDDVLESLKVNCEEVQKKLEEIRTERINYAQTHMNEIYRLLQCYSVGSQIYAVENKLESTEFVYRITGWIPAQLSKQIMHELDNLTHSRSGIKVYLPSEVSSVIHGQEKVPVKLNHGKLVTSFERMIFSYGAPLYGTVDPTPFVALFFTILFGIMFGDAGQGLVFLILGILTSLKLIKLAGWEKFAPIFIAIGCTSTIMGLLTGEFFANETILEPFALWVTGLFGHPHAPILHMMPSSDPHSILRMFMFFGFTISVGFIINTCGIIINIINQFSLRKPGKALFGKTGLSGAVFFWYVIAFALRIAFFGHKPVIFDWIVIGASILLSAFGEVLDRLIEGERPVLENGLLAALIGAVVEIIEIVSSYLSNTVSFVRVGAFALAHAVLGFIINSLVEITPGPGGLLVLLVGNGIVIVLEGMIVAIQVVRLQYYEFFSKFFTETGREFEPFAFKYSTVID